MNRSPHRKRRKSKKKRSKRKQSPKRRFLDGFTVETPIYPFNTCKVFKNI